MAKCEYFNVSKLNISFVNTSSKYCNGSELNTYNNDIVTVFNETYGVFVYVICSLGLIMNILNIAAILNAPEKVTAHPKLVISLAVSDMCVVMPELLKGIISILPYVMSYFCFFIVVFYYIEPGVILVSLLNLLMLGIDHYIAIFKPLHYNRIVSKHRITLCIVLIWIFGFVASVSETIPDTVYYFTNNESRNTFSFCDHMLFDYSPRFPYVLVIMELIVLIILYTRIYVAYKKHVTRRQLFSPDEQHNNKAIVTTLLIIVTFMIGWCPFSIMQIVYMTLHSGEPIYLWFITHTFKSFIFLNSSCDALIYALRLDVVKQGYKVMLVKVCKAFNIC